MHKNTQDMKTRILPSVDTAPINLFWHSYEHGYCLSDVSKLGEKSIRITVGELAASESLQHLLRMPQGFAFDSYAMYTGRMHKTLEEAIYAFKAMLKAFNGHALYSTINEFNGNTTLTLFIADDTLRNQVISKQAWIRENIIANVCNIEARLKKEPVPFFAALAAKIVEAHEKNPQAVECALLT